MWNPSLPLPSSIPLAHSILLSTCLQATAMRATVNVRFSPSRLCVLGNGTPTKQTATPGTRRSFASSGANLATWGFIGLGRMGRYMPQWFRLHAFIKEHVLTKRCLLQDSQWLRTYERRFLPRTSLSFATGTRRPQTISCRKRARALRVREALRSSRALDKWPNNRSVLLCLQHLPQTLQLQYDEHVLPMT